MRSRSIPCLDGLTTGPPISTYNTHLNFNDPLRAAGIARSHGMLARLMQCRPLNMYITFETDTRNPLSVFRRAFGRRACVP